MAVFVEPGTRRQPRETPLPQDAIAGSDRCRGHCRRCVRNISGDWLYGHARRDNAEFKRYLRPTSNIHAASKHSDAARNGIGGRAALCDTDPIADSLVNRRRDLVA